ncbi:hypothetical protein BDW66DRAFT_146288, partial [Aspergillus desertorum]
NSLIGVFRHRAGTLSISLLSGIERASERVYGYPARYNGLTLNRSPVLAALARDTLSVPATGAG